MADTDFLAGAHLSEKQQHDGGGVYRGHELHAADDRPQASLEERRLLTVPAHGRRRQHSHGLHHEDRQVAATAALLNVRSSAILLTKIVLKRSKT